MALDPSVTPELRAEGLSREVISRLQRLRKEARLDVSDRIVAMATGDPEIEEAVRTHRDRIAEETLAVRLMVGTEEIVARAVARPDPAIEAETPPKAASKEPPANAIPLIISAMRAIDPEGEWYSLGQIGQYITQANPDFDTRTYGSAKLSDLIRKIARFEVKQGSGNTLLTRDRA